MTAILIGDRSGLDRDTQRRLREAGTYHVIAISGGNVAILGALVLATLRVTRCGTRAASLATAAALVGYAYLVGYEASVVRATLGAAVYLVARAADLRTPPLNALAVVAAVMLVTTPLTIFDVGFALTFGATVAILIGVPRCARPGASGRLVRPAFCGPSPARSSCWAPPHSARRRRCSRSAPSRSPGSASPASC